jgi:hypothetical protein
MRLVYARTRAAAVAAVTALATSVGSATAYLYLNNWFGAGDLRAMVFWSVPVAAGVFLASFLVLTPATPAFRYVAAFLLGAGIGVSWTMCAAFLLGGWIYAFSFPVPVCWIAAGVAGPIAAVWTDSPRTWRIATVLLLFTTFGVARTFRYAQEPPPRVVLHLKPGITEAEIHDVWGKVLGETHRGRTGVDVKEPISDISRAVVGHDEVVLVVGFRKGQAAARDQLLAEIARSPLIARIEPVDPSEPAKVRRSVEY